MAQLSISMKVCHLITRMMVGGAQENTLATVIGLQKMPGYEVVLTSGPETGAEGTLHEQARRENVRHDIIPALVRNISPVLELKAYYQLIDYFRKEKFDLVHTHSTKAGILGRLAGKAAGVPIIVHTIHGLPFHPYETPLKNFIYIRAERIAAPYADKIICVADAMTEQALAAGVGKPDQYITIPSGMKIDAFIRAGDMSKDHPEMVTLRKQLGLQADDLVVGKIARLFELKGHEYLFAAAPKIIEAVPRVKFLLVGNGILREQFEAELRQKGLIKNFVFAGLIPPSDVPKYTALMDILIHLSLREGLARALPQALATGKPAVSYDVDGAREVIKDQVTGRLLLPKTINELADAVIDLLNNPIKARELGNNGRKLVQERFTEEYMVQKIHELYVELGQRESGAK